MLSISTGPSDCRCSFFLFLFVAEQSCFLSAESEQDSNWRRGEPVAAIGVPKCHISFHFSSGPNLTKYQPEFTDVAACPWEM